MNDHCAPQTVNDLELKGHEGKSIGDVNDSSCWMKKHPEELEIDPHITWLQALGATHLFIFISLTSK